ncbi:MAG: hypothetical protein Q7S40_30405 [Opitutaceae bacterium]|nr:hypothetical protein [Opitutaceae bacterium]
MLRLRAILFLLLASNAAAASSYFAIKVVDAASGRGVPLVELKAVNEAAWWTDSNGIVAFDEPGLMDLDVFFQVTSPGYEVVADGLGFRGMKLRPTAGGSATVTVKRLNLAERLYRVTGQGVYRDSMLTGHPVPTKHPVLNGQVMGQDTVIAAPYRDRIYWFWGDTQKPSYPLGHFAVSGATSTLPGRGGLDPGIGVDLTYFVDQKGFSKPMCPRPDKGMRWLEGVFTVNDASGAERLVSRLAVMKDLSVAHEWHLMVFNDTTEVFESIQRWELQDPHASAHPFSAEANGQRYIHIFPDWRVPADLEAMRDLDNYEAFTCVAGDGRWAGDDTKVQREPDGRVRYEWKRGAEQLTGRKLGALVASSQLRPEESAFRLIDVESGAALRGRPVSVAWNEFRKQWIGFAADKPGEVWFAMADTPVGPWTYARRIVTHGDYNFYNIAHHPFFDQQAGRVVYFEGTYTDSFSAAKSRTPRYNYNQIMYRLDLADERLLPVPIYALRDRSGTIRLARMDHVAAANATGQIEAVAFLALPPGCRREGTVPVFAVEGTGGTELSLVAASADAQPLFVALPLASPATSTAIDGTWRCRVGDSDDGITFELRLTDENGRVTAKRTDGTIAGRGTMTDRRLTLRLEFDGAPFDLEATCRPAEFDGTWRGVTSELSGTWSGKRVDPTPAEWKSPALVVLRRFQEPVSRSWLLPTDSAAPTSAQSDVAGLCRVWKAPTPTPIMDPSVRTTQVARAFSPTNR